MCQLYVGRAAILFCFCALHAFHGNSRKPLEPSWMVVGYVRMQCAWPLCACCIMASRYVPVCCC